MILSNGKLLNNLPTAWHKVLLGENSYIKGRIGWKGLKQSEYVDEGPFLIAGKHIKNGQIEWSKCDKISEERYQESIEIALKNGDIIFSKDGSLGNPSIIRSLKTKATINSTMMLVRVYDCFSSEFVFQVLQSVLFSNLIKERRSGSSIPHIFQRDMQSFTLPLPPLPEQQKIAEILSTVDDKVDVIDQQISETQTLKKGLMQRLLTKGIGHTEFKDSPLGEIPASWNVLKLKDISNVVRGGSPRPAGSSLLFNGDFLPWITVAELTNNPSKYIVGTKTKLTESGSKQTRILEPDTVVLANSGATLGIPRILKIRGGANDGIAAFLNLSKVSNDFLYFFLQSLTRYFREQLAPGSGQPNLNTSLIGGTLICVPAKVEQEKITRILDSVDEKLEVLEEKKTHYQELKQGLMQQLLTGKVRVAV